MPKSKKFYQGKNSLINCFVWYLFIQLFSCCRLKALVSRVQVLQRTCMHEGRSRSDNMRYFHHKNQIALIKTLVCQPASVWVPWSFRAFRDFLLSLKTLILKESCLSKCFYYVGCYRCLKKVVWCLWELWSHFWNGLWSMGLPITVTLLRVKSGNIYLPLHEKAESSQHRIKLRVLTQSWGKMISYKKEKL